MLFGKLLARLFTGKKTVGQSKIVHSLVTAHFVMVVRKGETQFSVRVSTDTCFDIKIVYGKKCGEIKNAGSGKAWSGLSVYVADRVGV